MGMRSRRRGRGGLKCNRHGKPKSGRIYSRRCGRGRARITFPTCAIRRTAKGNCHPRRGSARRISLRLWKDAVQYLPAAGAAEAKAAFERARADGKRGRRDARENRRLGAECPKRGREVYDGSPAHAFPDVGTHDHRVKVRWFAQVEDGFRFGIDHLANVIDDTVVRKIASHQGEITTTQLKSAVSTRGFAPLCIFTCVTSLIIRAKRIGAGKPQISFSSEMASVFLRMM